MPEVMSYNQGMLYTNYLSIEVSNYTKIVLITLYADSSSQMNPTNHYQTGVMVVPETKMRSMLFCINFI